MAGNDPVRKDRAGHEIQELSIDVLKAVTEDVDHVSVTRDAFDVHGGDGVIDVHDDL